VSVESAAALHRELAAGRRPAARGGLLGEEVRRPPDEGKAVQAQAVDVALAQDAPYPNVPPRWVAGEQGSPRVAEAQALPAAPLDVQEVGRHRLDPNRQKGPLVEAFEALPETGGLQPRVDQARSRFVGGERDRCGLGRRGASELQQGEVQLGVRSKRLDGDHLLGGSGLGTEADLHVAAAHAVFGGEHEARANQGAAAQELVQDHGPDGHEGLLLAFGERKERSLARVDETRCGLCEAARKVEIGAGGRSRDRRWSAARTGVRGPAGACGQDDAEGQAAD